MDFNSIVPGLAGEAQTVVVPENTAQHVGSGSFAVFSTPSMVGLMERAAVNALAAVLPAGWQTVGVHVDIRHLAATPLGLTVTARAELLAIEGRRLLFRVTAHDGAETVGEGQHERALIDLERFRSKASAKRGAPGKPG